MSGAFAWLLAFAIQAVLVARRRVALHRRLGWAGAAIAALVTVLGYAAIVEGAFREPDLSGVIYRLLIEPGPPPFTETEFITAFWGPFSGLLAYTLLVAAAIVLGIAWNSTSA